MIIIPNTYTYRDFCDGVKPEQVRIEELFQLVGEQRIIIQALNYLLENSLYFFIPTNGGEGEGKFFSGMFDRSKETFYREKRLLNNLSPSAALKTFKNLCVTFHPFFCSLSRPLLGETGA